MITAVRLYRVAVSPWTPAACRFTPTCSAYAIQALEHHGALKGGWLAARRILRCHPWGGFGYDPVPGVGGSGPGTEGHAVCCGGAGTEGVGEAGIA